MAIETEVCAAYFLLSIYKLRKENKLQIETHSEMTDAGTPPLVTVAWLTT